MNSFQLTPNAPRWNYLLFGAALLGLAWQAPAQTAPTTEPPIPTTVAATGQTAPVALAIGRTSTVTAPWPVKRIAVTDPKVADIQMISPRQVLITGKTAGTTDLLMWNSNEQALTRSVTVAPDHSPLQTELTRLFPDANLQVHQSNDVLVINGEFTRAEQAKELHRFLDTANVKYVDATTLVGIQQVQIKVTVAEANRTAIRALGINAFQTGGDFFGGSTIGPDGGGPINPISIGVPTGAAAGGGRLPFSFLGDTSVSPATTIFAGFPDANLQFFVQALAENQYLRVLAEPSLVALSGQEASFLAGGEFPIPVVQGAGSSTSGTSITIEYKEFGVRLRFRPTVMGDGAIRLHVAPEVSQLSTGTGALQIQGFSIPALISRKAETTLELHSGQTFAMAGLIRRDVQARTSQVPGLGDVPILGALFRSVRYQKDDTELLVLVTASLVEPLSVATPPPAPGVTHVTPNDWDLYAMGRIEGKTAAKISPSDAQNLKDAGLDQLRGPGAWADYDSRSRPGQATPTTDSPFVRAAQPAASH